MNSIVFSLGRFQLMCYKYLWDNMIVDNFPLGDFFEYFGLDPEYIFSEDVRQHISSSTFNVKVLDFPIQSNQFVQRYTLVILNAF